MPTTPPTIDEFTDIPSRYAPTTFTPKMESLLAGLNTRITQANAALAFVAAAMDALASPGLSATSATSLTVDGVRQSLTVEAAKSFVSGMSIKIAYTIMPSIWMHGDVFSYDPVTGALIVDVTAIKGGGTYASWTISLSSPISSELPKDYIYGLALTHAADTEHDMTVAAGGCRDATDIEDILLAEPLTKRFDASWTVGSTNGGMAAGESLPATGTIHLWLIKRSDTNVVDVMASNHATSGLTPSLPANYDYKRRIGSRRTDASGNIINGQQWGEGKNREFIFDTPILDYSSATPGTNAITTAISVPGGIIVKALLNVRAADNNSPYVSSLAGADLSPSYTVAPLCSTGSFNNTSGTGSGSQVQVLTNTSSQIRHRSYSNYGIYIATLGWEDSL